MEPQAETIETKTAAPPMKLSVKDLSVTYVARNGEKT